MKRIIFIGFILFIFWTINHRQEDTSEISRGLPAITVPSYEQLVSYPMDCSKSDQQLAQLKLIQKIKNFDPDRLSGGSRTDAKNLDSLGYSNFIGVDKHLVGQLQRAVCQYAYPYTRSQSYRYADYSAHERQLLGSF